VHRQAARLEALGAVSRIPDTGDHWRQNVMLTEDMQDVLDHFMDAVEAVTREFPARSRDGPLRRDGAKLKLAAVGQMARAPADFALPGTPGSQPFIDLRGIFPTY
jgi:hypothetical protein